MSEEEVFTIAILHVSEYHDWENSQTIISLLPDKCWIDVTKEELEIYEEYVHLKNSKTRSSGGHYTLIHAYTYKNLEVNFTLEQAKKAIEENRRKKKEAAEKRAKAKRERELKKKAKNEAEEKRLLQELKEKYESEASS